MKQRGPQKIAPLATDAMKLISTVNKVSPLSSHLLAVSARIVPHFPRLPGLRWAVAPVFTPALLGLAPISITLLAQACSSCLRIRSASTFHQARSARFSDRRIRIRQP